MLTSIYFTLLYILYYTILYYTILYYTILYYTILYYTELYFTLTNQTIVWLPNTIIELISPMFDYRTIKIIHSR